MAAIKERLRSVGGGWMAGASGAAIGILGVLLAWAGNPRNSGICVSCFIENWAGALGFHQDARMMFLRPEIIGFLLGAFLLAILSGDFQVKGGGAPLLRFISGFFLMVGSSVFIGCPIKLLLRLGAGDMTSLAGLLGLAAGIALGVVYLKAGFTLGPAARQPVVGGFVMPGLMLLALLALWWKPSFIAFSAAGPGALHAPLALSLGAGLFIGALAQRSRFCVTGSLRNLMLTGDAASAAGLPVMTASVFLATAALGLFHLGFQDQPGAHPDHLWNFLGLFLVGLAAVLVEGCPFRQLILCGEGDLDAGVTVMGLLCGAAAVYAWGIRSTTAGPTVNGKVAVLAGIVFCLLTANANRRGGK